MPSIHVITCICQFGEHYIKAHALIFIAVCVRGSITEPLAIHEFKRYMQEPLTNWRVNNVMEWWSDNQVKFPHVALMALKYLAIPASSAPSERVFSQLKLIVERKRWRMDGGRVERVIFLRCNKTSTYNF